MISVDDGKRLTSNLVNKVKEMKSPIMDKINSERIAIAYLGMDDDNAIETVASLYTEAMRSMPIENDEEDAAFCLVQINFKRLNELVHEQEAAYFSRYSKMKKWTDKEAVNFVETELLPIFIERFALVNNSLYFKEVWGYWRKVGPAKALDKIVTIACMMLPDLCLTASSRPTNALIESVRKFIEKQTSQNEAIIQFNDCIIDENCQLTKNKPQRFPRFIFDFNAWDVLQDCKVVPEVDDLIMHLCNYDDDTARCLIDRLSMMFITSSFKKSALDAKAIVLYGPTGKNGKSTFARLLERALNNENCDTFSFGSFKDYELTKVRNNLLLIDSDASSVHVSPEVSTAIKMAVTSDPMATRQIYKEAQTSTPLVQMLICSNAMPKAEDKTEGWDRRLEWYEVKDKLVRDGDWFNAINSDAAAQYLFSKLVNNAVHIAAIGKQIKSSDAILNSNKGYAELNRNVKSWLEFRVDEMNAKNAAESLVRVPSAKAYEEYVTWCEQNGETPFGLTNFNSIVSAETGLERKNTQLKADVDKEAFAWWQSKTTIEHALTETKAFVKCWVYKK